MAIENTLTGLVPTMYRAMHTVSRENVGALPGATIDASAAMAAKDQTVRKPVDSLEVAGAVTSPRTLVSFLDPDSLRTWVEDSAGGGCRSRRWLGRMGSGIAGQRLWDCVPLLAEATSVRRAVD